MEFRVIKIKHKDKIKELRRFGLTMGIILLSIALFLYIFDKHSVYHFLITGALFASLAIIVPQSLKLFELLWMQLGDILGKISSLIILSILFYLIVTPLSLLSRLFGQNHLELNIDRSVRSYWIYRKHQQSLKSHYERQF